MSFTIQLPVSKKLEQFFLQDPHSDVELSVSTKKYKLQKAYLRLESEYFRKIFQQNPSVDTFEIDCIYDPAIFEKILSCFYGGKFTFSSSDIYQVYELCHSFEIENLLVQLKAIFKEKRKEINFFLLYEIAFRYALEELCEALHNDLKENEFKILQKENIYDLSPKHPSAIVDLNINAFK